MYKLKFKLVIFEEDVNVLFDIFKFVGIEKF